MNRRKTLSDIQVKALKVEAKRYFRLDPELGGHYIRVQPTGTRTYVCTARSPNGKQIWTTIGDTDLYKIEESREEAREIIKRISKGLKARETPPATPDSYAAVAESWMTNHVNAKKLITAAEMRRTLDKYILPAFGDREFINVRRKDVAPLLDKIAAKNGPYQANAVLAVMRSLASWYCTRDEEYVSPFTKALRRETESRDRVLADDEIRKVWQEAEVAGTYGVFIRLLMLTGQRRDKVQHMRWSDISDAGVWTIPRESKREKATGESLKLPRLALDIIAQQPHRAGNAYVFASDRTDGPIVGLGKSQNRFRDQCGLKDEWRLHDLRRTARTLLGERCGVQPHVAERVIGHVVGSKVQRIYDQGAYDADKAHALSLLAKLISDIVTPPPFKVVSINRKKAVR